MLEVVYLMHLRHRPIPHLVHLHLLLMPLLKHHRVHRNLHLVRLVHRLLLLLLHELELPLRSLWHKVHSGRLLRRVLIRLETHGHHGWIVQHRLLVIHAVLPVLCSKGGRIKQRRHLAVLTRHGHRHHLVTHKLELVKRCRFRDWFIYGYPRCHRSLNRLL